MRKSVHLMMALVALGIVFGCAGVSFGQDDDNPPTVGGRNKATNDPEVVSAAEFAVSAQKKKENGPLSLVSIKSAWEVASRDYHFILCLEVKAGDEDDAGVESQNVEVYVTAPLTRDVKKRWKLERWEVKNCGK